MNDIDERDLRAKEALRREMAALPIEEKIRIVVRIQKMANEVRANVGRPLKPVWQIPDAAPSR